MQTLRKLAIIMCLSIFAFAVPEMAQAAPTAGISAAAPAVAASETSQMTSPLIQKAWWHRCWHCWHRWHYWHPYRHRYYWHRWHHWHRW